MFKSSKLLTLLKEKRSSWLKPCRGISFSLLRLNETCIYALASGSQRSGLAVIRLSGKKSYEVLTQMTKSQKTYEPRKMYLKEIFHPVTKEKIDKGLIVWFKEPNSFTGENVCEFHVHGGPAVVTSLIKALGTFENLRYAKPGEFSRRLVYGFEKYMDLKIFPLKFFFKGLSLMIEWIW